MDLHFAHGSGTGFQSGRSILRPVPAVVKPPLLEPVSGAEAARERWNGARRLPARQRRDVVVGKHAVVHADLVDVAAAVEVVGALHLHRVDGAGMRPELVQCGVEHSGSRRLSRQFAVHVEADAARLVPRKRQVHPLAGLWEAGHGIRHPRAPQVHIRHKRVETRLAVVINAQPHHVPARMIAVTDAEYGKRSGPHRLARPPEERQRAALGIHVARGPVGEQFLVAALNIGTLCAAGKRLHLVIEVVGRRVASRIIGRQAAIAGKVEKQSWLVRRAGGNAGRRNREKQQKDGNR